MAVTVSNSFVRQYESEVHHIYQQRASKLRTTVRQKTGINGESTTFQVIGKGTASTKAFAPTVVTPMELAHTAVTCTLANSYAGDWIDKLDELKLQHDERRAIAESGAFALGRKTDADIITAAYTTTQAIGAGATSYTLDKALTALETLGLNDALDTGRNYSIVGWQQWRNLLQIAEFASLDFVSPETMPFKETGSMGKMWLGTLFLPHTGLTLTVADRETLWYNERAIGHAIGMDVSADITWNGPEASWFVNNMMSQGACLIDTTGVVQVDALEV